MDKKMAVHFLDVVPRNAGVPTFEYMLDNVLALATTPGGRQLELTSDVVVRLERFSRSGDWLEGEVVRVQSDNIPPEATDRGLTANPVESLGHSAVFRYHLGYGLLVMQRNTAGMTVSRLFRYLRAANEAARYEGRPIPTQDLWDRFGRGIAKKLSLTLSGIGDPAHVEGEPGAIIESSARLSAALNGPTVHIDISAGSNPQGL